ncbi:MAG: DUF1207 domain-containing protein [Planctomycetota bacterium]|jgi:hypothetical protein
MEIALLLLLLTAQAQEADEPPEPPAAEFVWFPKDLLYPHPLADPRGPFGGSRFQFPIHREDDVKIETAFGGHISMARLVREEDALELELEGGTFARFNGQESLDMDGVDYRIGFPLVYRRGSVAAKLHPWHITSHLGDEYAEREGRKRIKYARNELAAGLSWDAGDGLRLCGEVGYGFAIGDPNEPWRAMGSVEWTGRLLGGDLPEVFAAANVSSFEESDWDVNVNLQAGVWFRPGSLSAGFRFGIEYYRGHSVLTQFFLDREQYWSIGFWLHF